MIAIFYLIGLVVFTRHQEHRFLLPILPFCHMQIAAVWYDPPISLAEVTVAKNTSQRNEWLNKLLYIIMIIQAVVASYLLVYHQVKQCNSAVPHGMADTFNCACLGWNRDCV
jgi:hypothetical protein